MQVQIELDPTLCEAYAVIHTPKVTPHLQQTVDLLSGQMPALLLGEENGRYYPLDFGQVNFFYAQEDRVFAAMSDGVQYEVRKRLYELESALTGRFLRISKSCLANLACIKSVQPSFQGQFQLVFQNSRKEYISRRYLPAFKVYLGLKER